MAAALTIAVLFTFSFLALRIAVVAMRIAGLSQNVTRFQRLLQLRNGYGVAEHVFRGEHGVTIGDLPPSYRELTLLAIRGNAAYRSGRFSDAQSVSLADVLICYGNAAANASFEDALA